MKLYGLLQTGMFLLAVALLAACQQEEMPDMQGEPLPPGKYPLELSVAGIEVAEQPSTRSTIDGNWTGDERIWVQVASIEDYDKDADIDWNEITPCEYTVSTDGSLTPVNESDRQYWRSTKERKYIRAYYTAGYNKAILNADTKFELPTDWSKLDLADDDVLYHYKYFKFNEDVVLEFQHLFAKIEVNLKDSESGYLSRADNIEVSFCNSEGLYTTAEYAQDMKGLETPGKAYKDYIMVADESSETTESIKLAKMDTQNAEYTATYSALMVPYNKMFSGTNSIVVEVDGARYAWELPSGIGITNGIKYNSIYSYEVTVSEHGLEVTVDNSIRWTENNDETGNGSVVIL